MPARSHPRVAIIADFLEEGWPSMDLVAEMLCANLRVEAAGALTVELIRPSMARRFSRAKARSGAATRRLFNADRLLNRFFDYPRHLRRVRDRFDLFHVTDHSYAHLTHALDASRTVVTCHDLDAFESLLDPGRTRRSPAFRLMTARILSGLRAAARVGCDSDATAAELLRYRLTPAHRTRVIPMGVAPEFTPAPDASADRAAARIVGAPAADTIEILHVGSTIARKRIDVALRTFAAIRQEFPAARLIRVGGPFTPAQNALARQLGVAAAIVVAPFVDRTTLAALYRRAAIAITPSAAEGFGLPVLEAMACGAPALASDIAALREVGGGAVEYAPIADIAAWMAGATRILRERGTPGARERRAAAIAWAGRFTWGDTARRYAEVYRDLPDLNLAPRAAASALSSEVA